MNLLIRRHFWLGFDGEERFKAHVDFGDVLGDERLNLYANFKHENASKRVYRLGTCFVSEDRNLRGHLSKNKKRLTVC